MRDCRDCGAKPGGLHALGCDVERCRLCDGQAISCDCVHSEDPEWDGESEATDAMWGAYDAKVAELGGRLAWSGEYPNTAECREYGLWCKWVDGKGREKCGKDDPGATEDLNRLMISSYWDAKVAKFVRSLPLAKELPK